VESPEVEIAVALETSQNGAVISNPILDPSQTLVEMCKVKSASLIQLQTASVCSAARVIHWTPDRWIVGIGAYGTTIRNRLPTNQSETISA